ncbi:hypothetical protein ACFYZ9_20895 [Streptomyces sp. NPDC001691]|uniref:SCO2584 family spore wall biosynthesis protein n=1 Tax=unclassified Streptomyces TaxID=2593676 RepID=UPI000DE89E65|nr:hypothetical protein [Streptomyces sp. SDr-06]RCH68617.1 hypothetical protein DT019_12820 [Streptomyces sp. SDr-06]
MPDDVGGGPFPDGWEPDDDRGGADDDFASVVFDEDFVRAAEIHEPSAVERLLAAAQARAEAEAARARAGGGAPDDEPYDDYDPYRPGRDPDDLGGPGLSGGAEAGPYGRHGGALRPYRGRARWHRPVAWLLAVVMGIGMIALAFSAVYRGATSDHEDKAPPPATSNVDNPTNAAGPGTAAVPGSSGDLGPPLGAAPATPSTAASSSASASASADYGAPPVPAVPRVP